MEHSSSETSTAASEHSASHEAAPSSSSRRDATAPNSSSAKHSGATLKHFNVKTLKSMCKNIMAQKNKRAYKYSRATKSLLIEYILELQEFEDDEQEPVTQLSSLSEEDREKELDARRKERDRIVNKSLNLAKKPKTVRNKMTQIKKLAEYLREEEPSVVFFQQPPRPADDHAEGEDEDDDHAEGEDEDEERHPSANHVRLFESGWQIKWGKLTPRILCRYLAGLEVERMSAQQLFLFDQAPKGKKPKFLKAHGLEAIVTAVKWAAGLVGKKFPPEWEKAMKAFLDGVKNDQAQEIKQGKRFKNDKSHRSHCHSNVPWHH
eukprot:INCI13431.3.p1 GENE.INCI13431.3~~INCI13431.3.p1  ORF type:complete len:320 (+),score=64.97 INCI13431.3:418-1377(+)